MPDPGPRSRHRCDTCRACPAPAPGIVASYQPAACACIGCARSSISSTRFAAGAQRRKVTPSAMQLRRRSARLPSCRTRKRQNRAGQCLQPRAGWRIPRRGAARTRCRAAPSSGGIRASIGKRELDRFRRGVEHDVERRVLLLDRAEDVGQESAFRKIPVLLRHLGRRAASATARRTSRRGGGLRPSAAGAAAGSAGATRRARAISAVMSSPSRPSPDQSTQPTRIVLAIGVVVAVLAVADFVARQQQRHALRQHQARQQIAAQLAPQLENIRIVRSAPRRRNSCCCFRRSRRDCPRHSPRCACARS